MSDLSSASSIDSRAVCPTDRPETTVASAALRGKTVAGRVVVGLSGGVDSSVAAWMLKEQGYEVIGLFMKNWEDDDDDEYCSTRQDWVDAASVADVIGIEIEAVNFAAEYRERVFADFLREYSAGRTPNPDVLCNAEIKFKAFLDFALKMGAQHIATGHYARSTGSPVSLLRGHDATKDQSYFLHRLTRDQLKRVMFPLGELPKTEVRELASRIGLANARKKDSTGICFIGERPFREFLNRYLPTRPGPMVTPAGQVIGEHVGLAFYTLGQRRGIGMGGRADAGGEPWYVLDKQMSTNTLVVGQGHDHPMLKSTRVSVDQLHWIADQAPTGALTAKTRYRQSDAACRLVEQSADEAVFEFTQPQWAVTPGQSLVIYQGEQCLGGGFIANAQ